MPERGAAPIPDATSLAGLVLGGDRRAIARALTSVERGDAAARSLVKEIFPHTGRAHLIGVTGSAGVGKSSLIAALTAEWRRRDRTVGVVAVDPTSSVTGGALLGDRVRMESLLSDRGVFVRSMATRGAAGGIARATLDAARVLDSAGFQIVLIETIGVGQDELAVAEAVETVLVVEQPGAGDDVQALKAGLLEIADLFVVTKGDQPGAERAVATLRATLALGTTVQQPPILRASAVTNDGIAALADALEAHLGSIDRLARARARAQTELRRILRDELLRAALARGGDPDLTNASAMVAAGELDPYSAAEKLTARAWPASHATHS